MSPLTSLRSKRLAALALSSALILTGCCDDTPDPTTDPTTDAPTDTETTPEAMEPATYDVTGEDYRFNGIPTEMAAGSTISFSNISEAEVHEIVAINLGDDERPLLEIMGELEAAFAGEAEVDLVPALVTIQGPGGEPNIPAIGDGTLTEPGRYLFLCAIQQGVAPADYFAEAARMQEAGEEGPVNIEGGGQPHAALGMVAEARVV